MITEYNTFGEIQEMFPYKKLAALVRGIPNFRQARNSINVKTIVANGNTYKIVLFKNNKGFSSWIPVLTLNTEHGVEYYFIHSMNINYTWHNVIFRISRHFIQRFKERGPYKGDFIKDFFKDLPEHFEISPKPTDDETFIYETNKGYCRVSGTNFITYIAKK